MLTAVKFAISWFVLAAACLAQDGLTIDNKHTERVSVAEAEKIYFSACSVVQREFDIKRPLHPGQTCTGGRQERDMVRGTGNQAYEMEPIRLRTGGRLARL